MFYKRETESIESLGHHLGEQLRERLRVALDFATLGAYELTSPEDEVEPTSPEHQAELALPSAAGEPLARERPQRVFLFSKVAPACPASPPAAGPRCAAAPGASRAAGRRAGRRAGGVRAPEQPCLCSPAKSRA